VYLLSGWGPKPRFVKRSEYPNGFNPGAGRKPYKLLQLHPSLLAGPSDSLRADVPGDRLMLLQLVGWFVLLLEGAIPTLDALQLADEA